MLYLHICYDYIIPYFTVVYAIIGKKGQTDMGIDVTRFINKLDDHLARNDMKGAKECLSFWESEARRVGDDRGLLTVLNESVGFFRRASKKDRALNYMEECLSLIDKLGLSESISGATVFINSATTMSFFGQEEEALKLYDRAALCFVKAGMTESYEYASLLNNKAATLYGLLRYDEAKKDWLEAIDILKKTGFHDGEIAISLLMLAHLTFDIDDTAYEKVESLLDEAWEYLNSDNQPKDKRYAEVLRKCVPSFEYFKRPMEANALREVIKEISFS